MIRVDYHFHPNLNLKKADLTKIKAKNIWEQFDNFDLNVVLSAEHAYKSPASSYEAMIQHKPKSSKTHLLPAIECLSAEGIDVIAFSKLPEHVYSHKDLLTPFALSVDKIVDLINEDEHLHGIVVHPHTPGTTSILRGRDESLTKEAIKRLGMLERHNCSFTPLLKLLKFLRMEKVLMKKMEQINNTRICPNDLCNHASVLTVGSDAHFPEEIGDHARINVPFKDDLDYLFKIITTKTGDFFENGEVPVSLLWKSSLCVLNEWMTKKMRSYKVDNIYEK